MAAIAQRTSAGRQIAEERELRELYTIIKFLHYKWRVIIFLIVDCEKLKMHILNAGTAMEKTDKIVNLLARLIKKSREKPDIIYHCQKRKKGHYYRLYGQIKRK